MMRTLVIGGSGFSGKRVADALAGRELYGLARSARAAEVLARHAVIPIYGDLDDPAQLDAAFAEVRPELLVCCASLGFGHAPAIIAAAEDAGVQRAVFVSTTAVTTRLNPASKAVRLAAERAIERSALSWTIVRPAMIYGGPDDRNMSRLLEALRRWPVLPVPGDGSRLQQPVHVGDLAQAIVGCIDRPAAVAKRYDVAGPEPLTFRRIIEQAAAALGRSPRIVTTPLHGAARVVGAYERLVPKPRLKAEQLLRLDEDKVFDISPARTDLSYAPRSFAEGISAQAQELLGR